MGMMWFWLLMAVGVAAAVWLITRTVAVRKGRNSPELIVERRFEKGEISRDDYERQLAALRQP
jgi:uncharacterized membrane protein